MEPVEIPDQEATNIFTMLAGIRFPAGECKSMMERLLSRLEEVLHSLFGFKRLWYILMMQALSSPALSCIDGRLLIQQCWEIRYLKIRVAPVNRLYRRICYSYKSSPAQNHPSSRAMER
jgi:hypothetical protein